MRINWPIATFLTFFILGAAGLVSAQKQGAKQKASVPAAAPKTPWSLSFHDGSGNGYRFWQMSAKDSARFEYSPVQPQNSSTGLYSGGKPKKGTVSAQQAGRLWQWVRKLEADTSLRADSRMKGTGAFRWKEGPGGSSGSERSLLVKGGALLREFDAFLSPFRDRK